MTTSPFHGLNVVRSGRALGDDVETFALIHGFGASSFTWRHWVPTLERRGHVVRIDLPACGGSPVLRDLPRDPVGQSSLVLDVLDQIGAGRRILVGHSLGGGIALHAALRTSAAGAPPSALVLVGSAAYPQRLPPFVAAARSSRVSCALFRMAGAQTVVSQILRSVVFDPSCVTNDMITGYARPLERPGVLEALLESALHIEPPDLDRLTARYPEVDAPTLLLWGRHDRVVPPWVGTRLARALPTARLVVLERCGHVPHEERPVQSLAALTDFLDRVHRAVS